MIAKRTPQEFYSAMADKYREETGFDPAAASDIGIRLRVLSHHLGDISGEIVTSLQSAFPQTATGQSLDLHGELRGLSRKPASHAGGILRFFRSTPAVGDIFIPEGAVCACAEGLIRFSTTAPGTIPAGETSADISAAATEAGRCGNLGAGLINIILSAVPGVSGVVNPFAFTGGSDGEDDKKFRARLMRRITDPPLSANEAFFREAALSFPGIRTARVLPRRRGSGTVDVIIAPISGHDGAAVAENLARHMEEICPAGIDLAVLPAAPAETEIAAMVVISRDHSAGDVIARCKAALTDHIGEMEIGRPIIIARLTAVLLAVDGIENLRFIAPVRDVQVNADQIARISSTEIERVNSL